MMYNDISDLRKKIKDCDQNMDLIEILISSAIDKDVVILDRDMRFLSQVWSKEYLIKKSLERKLERLNQRYD